METIAHKAKPVWKPDCEMPKKHRNFQPPVYGMNNVGDIFTPRQLVALTTFSDLVGQVCERIKNDAVSAGLPDKIPNLHNVGADALSYAEAIGVYLGITASKAARFITTLSVWRADEGKLSRAFGRQAIPMTWDYAETNPFSDTGGDIRGLAEGTADALERFEPCRKGFAMQQDAATQSIAFDKIISTDPPYYDNISYADLSDYFYVWLRRSLRPILPDLFATLVTPKAEELVASTYMHGTKEAAEAFFLKGMTQAMHRLAEQAHPAFPITIYYAFKQSETENDIGTASTGWETFLDAVISAGFGLSGTWPIHTEGATRVNVRDANALASSIILVCRPHATNSPTATRREFVNALKAELPAALANLQAGNVAPVDLAQAAIGPGMGVYTRYAKVLDTEGKSLSVRDALALINQTLDDALAEQEGDFDADSRWALTWFEQRGFSTGPAGEAILLSTAKGTALNALEQSGILVAKSGNVRLFRPSELPKDWDPETDTRLTTWEMVHHLIRVLEAGGEGAAAELVKKLGSKAETARELCYRLYTICERKKRAAEALSYNALVQSWPEIIRISKEDKTVKPQQTNIFEDQEG
jgi:putative DNA methylase